VFGFVKQSGGHVKIYSEPGSGTTVKIYLPRHAAAPLVLTREPDPVSATSVGETILVVEDEENVRKFTADVLSELGYRVTSAPDGLLALNELEKLGGVQLLFTDVGLPNGMNGRELAEEARRRWPLMKVLFTTGYARNAIVHHGRLDPGVELIVKPFTQSSLAAKIRKVLDAAPVSATCVPSRFSAWGYSPHIAPPFSHQGAKWPDVSPATPRRLCRDRELSS
jgi:CheY-like chemotaxis protein